jgi:hypothetical protein
MMTSVDLDPGEELQVERVELAVHFAISEAIHATYWR